MRSRFRRRRGSLRRRFLNVVVILLLAFLVWLCGLFYFATMIPNSVADPDRVTDGIVVLTGGSDRLREGLRLLAEGKAKRLLISGVSREAALPDLLNAAGAPVGLSQPLIDCCISIGYRAGNTAGNASETAEWAAANGLHSLRLVTADYHMPRSLLEFLHAMPGILIVPHPVFPAQVKSDEWWLWPGTTSLVVSEYHKYLAARGRGWIDDLVGS